MPIINNAKFIAQKYLKPSGKINVENLLEDINNGRSAAINFLNSEVKWNSDKNNSRIAKRTRFPNFKPFYMGGVRARIPMEKPEEPFVKSSVWVGGKQDGYFLYPGLIEDSVLGRTYTSRKFPYLDQMYISTLGEPSHTAFHETLHRGGYGDVSSELQTPETLDSYADTKAFYLWKTDKLLTDEGLLDPYLSDPVEAAVNALHIGRELNLPIGTKYPGKQAALRFFEDASNKDGLATPFLNSYNWKKKPKRVWDAITGRYYLIPLAIGGAVSKNE